MQSISLGLSGLNAARAALDVIGNNVVNAATEGYHRQRIELAPSTVGQVGGGVNVAGVTRMIDMLLESEILRQESSYGQVSTEGSLLSTVETAFGEFAESGGLNATIDKFFDSLRRLAANPLDRVLRNDVLSAAQALAGEFRRLGSSLQNLEDQMVSEAQSVVDAINLRITQIGALNGQIQNLVIGYGAPGANNLCDQRDRLITELAKLTGLETQPRENGMVDVSIAGIPVVTGSIVLLLEVHLLAGETLAVSARGAQGSALQVEGGRLGGLLTLKNELLGDLRAELDTLARAIMEGVNRVHVQGLGRDGPFRELAGGTIGATDLTALGTGVTDGTFYLRVTNTATGEIQRHAIEVHVSGPAPDTPASVAAKIDALAGLNASLHSAQLYLAAAPGYTFDFLPMVLPEPTATHFTAAGAPAVSVSGLYSGAQNHVFTFTAAGSGSVGNGNLQLEVRDEDGDLLRTVNIGQGYAAGDAIELRNGLRIALGAGQLEAGDHFQVEALATTDTSGFLAAAGLNTFFSGAGASEMQVNREVLRTPDRIATAWGGDLMDNVGALRLAALRDEALEGLMGMTPGEYYQRTVANLGQQVGLKRTRQENVEAMLQNLGRQRSDLSAVDINEEAAQLVVFEQMFQAAARYLSSLQTTMAALMEIL